MSRAVVFAEVPSFYAEIERGGDPTLADRPVIVGGDPRKRGLVQSATADALALGVSAGMPMLEALQLCPGARALRTDMRRYRDVSLRLRTCMSRRLERIEPAGLDAAYLDGTPSEQPLESLAVSLRDEVRNELALPLRVGIASARFLARIAAEAAGETGVVRVEPGQERQFLRDLPVGRLPGVGPRIEAQLEALAVRTVGDLAELEPLPLEEALGNHGLSLLQMARGHGDDRVRAAWQPQSFHQETTLTEPALDRAVLAERLQELAQGLCDTLEQQSLAARRVQLRLAYADADTANRTQTLPRAVRGIAPIHATALALLDRTEAGARPVRRVALSVAALQRSPGDERQLDLFQPGD